MNTEKTHLQLYSVITRKLDDQVVMKHVEFFNKKYYYKESKEINEVSKKGTHNKIFRRN